MDKGDTLLKHRVLSALIGMPIILGCLFWSECSFLTIVAVIAAVALCESVKISYSLQKPLFFKLLLGFGAALYITTCFTHLFYLRASSVWWAFLAITATWVYDTAAYGFGVRLGKHKMSPKISPDKTWEGTLGGLAATLIYLGLLSRFGWLSLPNSLMLGAVVSLTAALGDLIESRFKRYANIKDTGKLILGHGGFLDRFDSLMLVSVFSFWFLRAVVV